LIEYTNKENFAIILGLLNSNFLSLNSLETFSPKGLQWAFFLNYASVRLVCWQCFVKIQYLAHANGCQPRKNAHTRILLGLDAFLSTGKLFQEIDIYQNSFDVIKIMVRPSNSILWAHARSIQSHPKTCKQSGPRNSKTGGSNPSASLLRTRSADVASSQLMAL